MFAFLKNNYEIIEKNLCYSRANGLYCGRCPNSGLWLQVDASRRRNDPHKRAKAPVSMVRLRGKSGRRYSAERGSSGEHTLRSEPSCRRVWGQRPGQPKTEIKISNSRREKHIMYEDRTLVCRDCGKEFIFSAGEQEFYARNAVARNAGRHARTQRAVSSARCSTPSARHAASPPRCRSSRETTSRSIAPSALHSAAADKNLSKECGQTNLSASFFVFLSSFSLPFRRFDALYR